ncbi:hypothetical protein [Pleionea sp. CnH1-48]|uniref:hypothetical protein n=1 Tax=Pleionea sp. CnH1-48 TaxID=2954494 RepID=UPI002097073A|nr:hypothetical protein [Pleionea sp. CnH1-48]MCO7222952.1 hypothetical protein [Pleionea sp. CnH1-48]
MHVNNLDGVQGVQGVQNIGQNGPLDGAQGNEVPQNQGLDLLQQQQLVIQNSQNSLNQESPLIVTFLSDLFFDQETPIVNGMEVSESIVFSELMDGAMVDGQQTIVGTGEENDPLKWGIQLPQTIAVVQDENARTFVAAHEYGHLATQKVFGEEAENISRPNQEIMADCIGAYYLLTVKGMEADDIVQLLQDNEATILGVDGDEGHPSSEDRIDAVRTFLGLMTVELDNEKDRMSVTDAIGAVLIEDDDESDDEVDEVQQNVVEQNVEEQNVVVNEEAPKVQDET